jgi:predicted alpha/beta-hydrolase family hydrolase
MEELMIPAGDGVVSASLWGSDGTVVALGHGAGGDRRNPFLRRLAEKVASSGRRVLLFNFPYSERHARIPDPPGTLEKTIEGVARYARDELGAPRLVLGGKSMGGRIASQAVAKGVSADGLVFLGYPLHPPGRTETLRDAHLPLVSVPMLFVQGTRDAFARSDLLAKTLARLGERATLFVVEGGDHSFRVPKSRTPDPSLVEAAIAQRILAWLEGLGL